MKSKLSFKLIVGMVGLISASALASANTNSQEEIHTGKDRQPNHVTGEAETQTKKDPVRRNWIEGMMNSDTH